MCLQVKELNLRPNELGLNHYTFFRDMELHHIPLGATEIDSQIASMLAELDRRGKAVNPEDYLFVPCHYRPQVHYACADSLLAHGIACVIVNGAG